MQPFHAIDDGRWAENHYWAAAYQVELRLEIPGRCRRKNSLFGSDWPVAPLDPVMGIYAATHAPHASTAKNPNGWIPEQRISVAQAVHAYTMGSAFAEHQETVKGSIEPGKTSRPGSALRRHLTIPPEAIEKTRVDMTIFDGKVIFQRREGPVVGPIKP